MTFIFKMAKLIMRYKDLVNLSNNKFKRLVGVKKQTFDLMIRILSFAYAVKHEFGGKPDKLGLEEKLLIELLSFFLKGSKNRKFCKMNAKMRKRMSAGIIFITPL